MLDSSASWGVEQEGAQSEAQASWQESRTTAEAPSDPQDTAVEGTAPERLKSVGVRGGTGTCYRSEHCQNKCIKTL